MFDLSWLEIFFVGVLALVVIGPKDLPGFFKGFSNILKKSRRMYQDLQGSILQLEREINIIDGKDIQSSIDDLLPEEIRHLPDDFIPGSMSAEEHQAFRQKQREYIEKNSNDKSVEEQSHDG